MTKNKVLKLLCIAGLLITLVNPLFSAPDEKKSGLGTAPTAEWFRDICAGYGSVGTMTIFHPKDNRWIIFNPERADEGFLPASTFKIPNSLISLETGVIKDENEIIAWDGQKRFMESWNRDLNMKEALKVSAVWFYQELARRVGSERMNWWLKKISYGNMNAGGGVDTFWLDGELRISARQQVNFLVKLYNNDLPFSRRAMDIVREILTVETTDKYTFRAKTGTALRVAKPVGWYVGWLERKGDVWFFAINIDLNDKVNPQARIEIPRKYFQLAGLMEAPVQ